MDPRKGSKVLIVDDEPNILSSLQDLLEKDYPVVTSVDAEAALELLRDSDVSVVVSDQRMPGMGGDEFLARAREISPATRILLTGYTDLSALARAVNQGQIYAYVTKPWKPADLKALVRRASDHAALQRDLEEEQRLLHALMDSVPDHIYFKDREGRYVRVNRARAKFLGVPFAEDVIGRTASELLPESIARAIDEEDREILSTGKPLLDRVERVVMAKGGVRWESTTKVPIRDSSGAIAGLIGITRDVTEQKAVEEAFRQAQKMDAVGRLAGGIAHDFNNLLTAILGHSELGLMSQPPQPFRNHLLEIRKAGERAAALTHQLLAHSRKQVLSPKILDLNAVVEGMEGLVRRLIGENIEVQTCLAEKLGRVSADPGQMEQVLLNLIVNSRDAMPRGGTLVIGTRAEVLRADTADRRVPPGSYVVVSVSDNGSGMDAETRTHIFEPFFTTKEPGKGTGLGLATVYGIVKQSGGDIVVKSEPGCGTTFEVYLPRVETPTQERATSGATLNAAGGSETILIVEDEHAVRRLASTILSARGYTILEASDGDEALAALARHPGVVHLVLSDVVLKGMSGQESARRLSELRPGIKVLFMSGYTNDAILRNGALEGGTAFLEKPFAPTGLARKVREVLD
jgi:two-component system, cell cycle sensor histidine kinase and response regulator CckA